MSWFLNRTGQPEGPYEDAHLLHLIHSGQVRGGYIGRHGDSAWMPIEQHPTFGPALHAAHAAAVPAAPGMAPAVAPLAPSPKKSRTALLVVGLVVGVVVLGSVGALVLLQNQGKAKKLADLCAEFTKTLEGPQVGDDNFMKMLQHTLTACSTACDLEDDPSCQALDQHLAKVCGVTADTCDALCGSVKSPSLKKYSCDHGSKKGSGAKRLDHPPTEDGLKTLLTMNFASASAKPADVVAALKPDGADYAPVFEGDAASKVQANTDHMLASPPAELGKAGDHVQVFLVTLDDLKSGSDAAQHCPGGYTRITPSLKSGVTLYCAKVGSISYDIFSHVNGHWVWFPKAFRAFRD